MIEVLLLRDASWYHICTFPPLSFNSSRCELTRAFCLSQGTVWAKQRPGSVCTTMITGVRKGPIRVALSGARVKRTSGCTATPLGSTPQGPSSWWRKAVGWMTSTAMTGGVTEQGNHSLCIYMDILVFGLWPTGWLAGGTRQVSAKVTSCILKTFLSWTSLETGGVKCNVVNSKYYKGS